MHTEVGSSNVPAFLTKLWKLVEDSDYDHLISWGPNEKSFIIRNQARFAKELLPLYFKHNNMASFIRQLNMYGFRKLANIENSGLRLENDEIEFYHAYFLKGQENLLEFIKRKVRNETTNTLTHAKVVAPDEKIKKEEVKSILMDMKGIKGKQDSIDSFLVNLRRENEALWREVALLRQKHQKQQQIVEKLIQFFLTLVHNRGLGLKRNFPLMIDSKNGGVGQLRVNMSPPQNSGPVIHDVTDHLLDEDCLANVSGSNGSSSNSTSDNGKMSNALIEENSKSPFSASEISESDLKAVANSAALDPLELAFAETQNDTNEILNNEEDALDPLDQLNSVQPDDLLPLEPPLIDPTSLVEESVIAPPANDSIKPPILNATDPLQLESNAGNTTRSPSQSANNSLVPSTSSVLNTPTYTIDNIDDHLEGIDTELSWLQEQLSLGGLNIDTNTLMGLFAPEDELLNHCRQPATGNEMIEYVPRQLLTATKTPTTIPTSSLMEPETRQLASPSNLNTKPATPEANAAQVYQPINYAYPSLVSSNESAATLYDSSSNAITDQSVNVASPVDLLDGELNSGSLSTKDDLGPQLEQLNQNSLFDAAELLNSESDIDKILEPKPFGNDKKRRKIA